MCASPELTGSTSHSLLQRVQRHEARAWERFAELYGPLVYGWCRKSQLKSSDASDVAQEVFIAVFTAIGDFRHDRVGDTLRGWMRTIYRNKLNDFFRRRAATAQGRGGDDPFVEKIAVDAEYDDESTITGDRDFLIRRAAELVRNECEPRSWQAFWLVTVELRSAVEVAAQLGMTPGAVRQLKYKILRKLRNELHGELDY